MRGLRGYFIAMSTLIVMSLSGCAYEESDISVSSAAVSIDNLYAVSQKSSDEEENTEEHETEEENIIENEENNDIYTSLIEAKAGDYVLFGSYEQDNEKANGAEPIEWIVLDAKDDKILVLSRYVLDKKAFNETDKQVSWAQSTVRKWLNDDFLKLAFSDKEIEHIVTSDIENPGSAGYFAEFKKKAGTAAGKKTKDKMFLLSYKEILDYFEPQKIDKFCMYADKDLITIATIAAQIENKSMPMLEYETFYKEEGWPKECVGVEGSGWFLRSNGINADDIMSISYAGALRGQYAEYGADYEKPSYEGGIRPAMWVTR